MVADITLRSMLATWRFAHGGWKGVRV
jgi:hypothetical protein